MSSTQEVGPIFGEGEGPAQAMLRSPTVIIASIGFWGMNIYFFRLFKLDYVHIMNLDLVKEREEYGNMDHHAKIDKNYQDGPEMIKGQASPGGVELMEEVPPGAHLSTIPFGNRITWDKCIGLSLFLIVLLHVSEYVWVDTYGGSSIGAVFFFYAAFCFAIAFPLTTTRWIRIATLIVFERTYELFKPRCITQPPAGPRPIPFIDNFYADAMCSLSKVFFDWGMLFHMASHYPHPVPKEIESIIIPSLCAAIPFLIRARQCMIMYTVGRLKHDPKRYQHLLNALKYCTSIFPICLSAYQKTLSEEHAQGLEYYLIILLVINASYALAWDIIMDWGMFQDPTVVAQYACAAGVEDRFVRSCGHALMRPKLRFGMSASAAIVFADTVLRFSWLLRFCQNIIFPNKDQFVLATQLLEAFRRAIWNLLRVEWENIKQQQAKAVQEEEDEDDEMAPLFKPPPAPSSLQMTHVNGGTS